MVVVSLSWLEHGIHNPKPRKFLTLSTKQVAATAVFQGFLMLPHVAISSARALIELPSQYRYRLDQPRIVVLGNEIICRP